MSGFTEALLSNYAQLPGDYVELSLFTSNFLYLFESGTHVCFLINWRVLTKFWKLARVIELDGYLIHYML